MYDSVDGGGKGTALAPRELLALQLASRGYTPRQIAALREIGVADVLTDLGRAAAALGATDTRAAIVEARRRRLIV